MVRSPRITVTRLEELIVKCALNELPVVGVELVVDDATRVDVGGIPQGLAEPLDEVRVAVDVAGDLLGRLVGEGDLAGVVGRVDERERRVAQGGRRSRRVRGWRSALP